MKLNRYNQFIREFIENSDNILDNKMVELKDLVNSISDGHNMIYEWENKNDHELVINFTINSLTITYQFDIDSLYVQKVVGGSVDFHETVESIDEGLSMIEKDIHMVMGIGESYVGQWDSSITDSDVNDLAPTIEKVQEFFSRLHEEDLILHIAKIEKILQNYDKKVRSFIIDLLLYGSDSDIAQLEESIINLGDDIMYQYGTEPRMVLNAMSDVFEYASRYVNITE
jgi:hypothetical protein